MTSADLIDRVADNAARVHARIARAADRAGRAPREIQLVAVTKTFPLPYIEAAAAAGLRDLGENRVQEALEKIAATDVDISWHLIGHLQANKARRATAAFEWIHSVDSVRLLERLEQAASESGTHPKVLVQVDLAGEATKHGASLEALREIVQAGTRCTAVRLCGLMVLPPLYDDPEHTRPYFRRLRRLRDELVQDGIPLPNLHELSMGMSHDFEVAVEEGSTMVRLGTALFGPRERPPVAASR